MMKQTEIDHFVWTHNRKCGGDSQMAVNRFEILDVLAHGDFESITFLS